VRSYFAILYLLTVALICPAIAQTGLDLEFADDNVYVKEDKSFDGDRIPAAPTEETMAEEVFRLTNEARISNGLPALKRNLVLEGAASEHSREMRTLNYFSHTSPTPGNETARKRVQKLGLNPKMIAENIFECSGYDLSLTARFAVEAFLNSAPHRKNLMDERVTHIGIGVCEKDGSVSVTQVFGAGI
jgi:uncharacterized protein YkwD